MAIESIFRASNRKCKILKCKKEEIINDLKKRLIQ
jgi:hypothetical protein